MNSELMKGIGDTFMAEYPLLLKTKWGGQKVGPQTLVLITGASGGIGEAVARLLIGQGARVILLARSFDKLQAIKASMDKEHGAGKVFIFRCDCAKGSDVDAMAREVKASIGIPDVIINNAGAGCFRFLHESTAEEIKSDFNAPAISAALVTRAFFTDFVKRDSGAIVQLQSPASRLPFVGATSYAMSRWALRGLSEALRMDLYGTNVKVQEVILGEVSSDYFKHNPGSKERLPPGTSGFGIDTDKAAKTVVKAIKSGSRSTYYPVAIGAMYWWLPYYMRKFVGVTGMKTRERAMAVEEADMVAGKGRRADIIAEGKAEGKGRRAGMMAGEEEEEEELKIEVQQ